MWCEYDDKILTTSITVYKKYLAIEEKENALPRIRILDLDKRFQFFIDYAWILERFWDDFGKICRLFVAFLFKMLNLEIREPTQCSVRVELLKINKKSSKNR